MRETGNQVTPTALHTSVKSKAASAVSPAMLENKQSL